MKKNIFLLLAFVAMAVSCKDADSGKPKTTEMTFAESVHDFGDINQGDVVSHDFKFKNTGDEDLLITGAVGSCGCTVPEYPKDAIAPGEDGIIKVKFNSAGKKGRHTKSVTLMANTGTGSEKLEIKVNINPGENAATTK